MVIHGVWIVGSLFHMGFNSGLNEMKLARNYLWAIRSVNVVICSGKLFCGFLFLVHNVGVLDIGGLMRWLDYDAINNYWTRLNVPVQREKVYKRRINCDLMDEILVPRKTTPNEKMPNRTRKITHLFYSTQGHWFRYLLPLIPLYKNFMYEMPVTQNLWYVKQ